MPALEFKWHTNFSYNHSGSFCFSFAYLMTHLTCMGCSVPLSMKYVPRILHWYKKMKAYCPIFISVHVLLKWSVWIKSWATEQEQSKSRPAPGKLVVPKGWREALGTSARGRLQKQTWSVSEDMHLKKNVPIIVCMWTRTPWWEDGGQRSSL